MMMDKKFKPTNELILCAFVDGQLSHNSTEIIINAMEEDADLREQVYQLRRAKDLMKIGFNTASPPSGNVQKTKKSILKKCIPAIAASIFTISIGLGAGGLGFYLGTQFNNDPVQSVASNHQTQADKIVLHISESDPKQYVTALDYAENFMKEHEKNGGQIVIIAHAGGVNLLRADVTPYEKQVIEMMNNYNNVYFIACANAIRNLRKKGIEPVLLENVRLDKPAMDHIIEYVQAGWQYKKVKDLMKES